MQVPVCVRRFPEDSHVQSAPSLRVSFVSRKGREPSLSSSMVNLMVGRMVLLEYTLGDTHVIIINTIVNASHKDTHSFTHWTS